MTHEQRTNGEAVVTQVRETLTQARDQLSGFDDLARAVIRERPVAALLTAAGIGYVTARLFARL